MNLPNKLTVARVVMIPVFVAFFLTGEYLWAFVTFAAASLTDMLDGKIARKHGLITDFGVLMDPLADKLLVMSAMLCFVNEGLVHVAVVISILAREFLVTSIRLVAAGKGAVLAADRWGKLKTAAQMLWICIGLLYLWGRWLWWLRSIFSVSTYVVLALTVLSGFNYVVKNRELFRDA